MVSSLKDSVKTAIKERSISPLFGFFILSWCVWNYRFLLVFFSSLTVYEKFNTIESLYPTLREHLWKGAFGPLLTTCLTIFVYPYPAQWSYAFWLSRLRELNKIKQRIDGDTLLSVEDSQKLRLEYQNQLIAFDAENEKQEAKINQLRESLRLLQAKAPAFEDPLPQECISILRFMGNNGGLLVKRWKEISGLKNTSNVDFKYFLEILKNKNLIENAGDPLIDPTMKLTSDGKKMVLAQNLI